ncbi:transposase [Pseudoalteromonas sp. NBT06-2]|uniref:transposase n=1 Tax=Pseudoalteromonas sp. NBT06-2 TaxID=2025950 RepID=UPI0014820984
MIGGDVHDSKVANGLIELLPQNQFIVVDKGYDSEAIRDKVRECNSTPIIPVRGFVMWLFHIKRR